MDKTMLPLKKIILLYAICHTFLIGCGKHEDSSVQIQGETPTRIVSLTPSATSLLVALDKVQFLVGRDAYSVIPKEILSLPVVGDFMTPNIEAIAALKPSLVLLDQSQQSAEDALKTLSIPTLSLRMHQLSDVRKGLIEVGKSLGVRAKADEWIAKMDAKISSIRKIGSARNYSPKVLILIDRAPDALRGLISVGPNTYIDELLGIVGATNVMGASPVPYPQISAEQIMRSKPDIIIDLSKSKGGKSAFQSIAEVPAVANDRVFLVESRDLLSPSPRLAEALEQMQELTSFP